MTGWLLVVAVLPWQHGAAASRCGDGTAAALAAAQTAADAGEFTAAADLLRRGQASDSDCGELVVAARAWSGWLEAVAAAARGGSDEALAGVRGALDAFGPSGPGASAGAYATAVLRAAAAAAQDERDEMRVWLEHARDVAARLALVRETARWPLSIDLVDGELWSSVDDYELAEASYTRALADRDSALAWRGLARARDRRGHQAGACAAYRRAFALAVDRYPKGDIATEARGYLLVCER